MGSWASKVNARWEILRPAIVVVYLAALAGLCVCSAAIYLNLAPTPQMVGLAIAIVFGVYILNRFSDVREDFVNDPGRAVFFRKRQGFHLAAVALLLGAVVALVATRRLGFYFLILVFLGVDYSYRIMPWYSPKKGFTFIRLKEVPVAKNVCVAALWGMSVFAVPILLTNVHVTDWGPIVALAVGLAVSTLNSTLFGDIMDVNGDSATGNRTLPVLFGQNAAYTVLYVVNVVWALALVALAATQIIDLKHFGVLMALCLYPFSYLLWYRKKNASRSVVELASESDLLVFSVGVLALTVL